MVSYGDVLHENLRVAVATEATANDFYELIWITHAKVGDFEESVLLCEIIAELER